MFRTTNEEATELNGRGGGTRTRTLKLQLCLHRPAYASAESVDLPNLLTRTNEEANDNEPMFMVPPAKERRSGDGRRPECANAAAQHSPALSGWLSRRHASSHCSSL